MHVGLGPWEGHDWSPIPPGWGPLAQKPPHTPRAGLSGWGTGRGREVLGAPNSGKNFSGRSAARPGAGVGAGATAAPAPLSPPAALLPPLVAGTRRPRDPAPARGGPGRAGGASPRVPFQLQRPVSAARAPPQPAGAPRPSPSPLSLPPLGTMAAPSRHPLPPGPASRFLCQTKRDGRRVLGGGCGGAHPQGRPGRRKRDAGRAALARGPGEPLWGSALGRKGLHRPAPF